MKSLWQNADFITILQDKEKFILIMELWGQKFLTPIMQLIGDYEVIDDKRTTKWFDNRL